MTHWMPSVHCLNIHWVHGARIRTPHVHSERIIFGALLQTWLGQVRAKNHQPFEGTRRLRLFQVTEDQQILAAFDCEAEPESRHAE